MTSRAGERYYRVDVSREDGGAGVQEARRRQTIKDATSLWTQRAGQKRLNRRGAQVLEV